MNDTEYLQKLVQVARLYYEENMTHQAISKKLGTTRQSISKMLSEARERSIVEIKINDVETNLSKAAQMIKEIFPIQNVTIVPGHFNDDALARKMLAQRAALYFDDLCREGLHKIGISWGRSVYSFVEQCSESSLLQRADIFPLGGASSQAAAYFMINEMVRMLSEKTGGTAHFINLPLGPLSPEDYELFTRTQAYAEILDQWQEIDLAVIGIGAIGNLKHRSYYPGESELLAEDCANIIGDICTHYFDLQGRITETIGAASMIRIPFENLAKVKRVLALVNGNEKIDAVTGALKLGIVTDIIIDEALAEGIIARLS